MHLSRRERESKISHLKQMLKYIFGEHLFSQMLNQEASIMKRGHWFKIMDKMSLINVQKLKKLGDAIAMLLLPSKKKLFRHHEGSQVDRGQSAGRRRWSIATSAKSFPQGGSHNGDEWW